MDPFLFSRKHLRVTPPKKSAATTNDNDKIVLAKRMFFSLRLEGKAKNIKHFFEGNDHRHEKKVVLYNCRNLNAYDEHPNHRRHLYAEGDSHPKLPRQDAILNCAHASTSSSVSDLSSRRCLPRTFPCWPYPISG